MAQPTFFTEQNLPLQGDNDHRLLAKVAGSTYDLARTVRTEGEVDATPAGGVAFGVDASNVLRALLVTSAGALVIQQADLNADIDDVSTFEGAISKRVDEVSDTILYIGEAAIGSSEISSVWRIRKIDFTNPTSIKWAGTGIFDQVWSNRASLTYT